jgi:hypothetical protein
VSRPPVLDQLRPFVGKTLIESIDEITRIAGSHRYTVNIVNPQFKKVDIDEEPLRLNVRTDRDSVVTMFTIG